ncbi:MFS transporter [Aliidongia dinghuensis]|uniref:MFS transporter n=1 Tax=Aliidongia dinghuensis TaxID=1867774 RepID=A0A8J2YPF7_9PROT|nr:MFS transporter [Aliidongia dinghuensis]GGF00045.1 MFS transporter [Aliidongia dinghuensis]
MFVLSPLSRRPIAALWTGQVLAATGAEFYAVAVVWVAADLIGRDAGYLSALQAGGLFTGSLFGGIVTDRWRHGTTMIAADLMRAALVLVLSLAGLAHLMSLPLLVAIAGAVSLVTASFDPSLQATLPALAPDPTLRHATNGLFDATKRMARIMGPSLIALVNGVLPTGQFFAVTAATFVLSALAVRWVTRRLGAEPAHRAATGAAAVIDSVVGGFRAVRGHPVVIYGLLGSLVANSAWAADYLLGMVLYLRETSEDPLTSYGLMMTAYGIGNVASNLILASLGPGRPALRLIGSKIVFGLGILALPLCQGQAWLMVVAGLTALNGPLGDLAMLHLLQTSFAPHRLAQVFRMRMCVEFAGMFLGYLAAPVLFDHLGLATTIMGLGAATMLAGLAGIGFFAWRRYGAAPSAA